MSKFTDCLKKDLNEEVAYGENGMPAYKRAGDKCLEFFYAMGALRDRPEQCVSMFELAFEESPVVAMQLAFLLRDIRGGNGERSAFREIMKVLEQKHSAQLIKVLQLIPKYGRWDDLEIFSTTKVRKEVYKLIGKGLKNDETSGLCAKWISRNDKGDKFISGLRSYLKLSPKDFRKTLVSLSSTLEQKMSAKDWGSVDYNKLPSQAMAKHTKAFVRNDEVNYNNYLQGLSEGNSKVNAATLYPYQIINGASVHRSSEWTLKQAQWEALPNYFGNSKSSILPMIDVSGSMSVPAGNTSITCMDVAVSLGMYISSKQEGDFKNAYLTFDTSSKLNFFDTKNLKLAAKSVYDAEWGGSTNLKSAFRAVLDFAVKHNLKQEELPEVLLILSDMNFNVATIDRNNNALTMIQEIYAEKGYVAPKLVFWNLRHNGTFVAQADKNGVMMLSGFAPSLLQDLVVMMNEDEISPVALMMKSLSRYNDVEKALL